MAERKLIDIRRAVALLVKHGFDYASVLNMDENEADAYLDILIKAGSKDAPIKRPVLKK